MADSPTKKVRPRWFPSAPDRCVLGLLAVESVLWLSNWFRWLPKGYGVLLAVASVAVFFLLMLGWFLLALVFRLRFQFSLLSLLVLMVAVALPFAWLAAELKVARKQKEAVEGIRNAGVAVAYDYECNPFTSPLPLPGDKPPGPAWLRKLLGDDLFADVWWIDFRGPEVSDAGLEHLKRLPQLQELDLRGTNVTDAGVKNLKQALPNCQIRH
jgi:hypothetical protein